MENQLKAVAKYAAIAVTLNEYSENILHDDELMGPQGDENVALSEGLAEAAFEALGNAYDVAGAIISERANELGRQFAAEAKEAAKTDPTYYRTTLIPVIRKSHQVMTRDHGFSNNALDAYQFPTAGEAYEHLQDLLEAHPEKYKDAEVSMIVTRTAMLPHYDWWLIGDDEHPESGLRIVGVEHGENPLDREDPVWSIRGGSFPSYQAAFDSCFQGLAEKLERQAQERPDTNSPAFKQHMWEVLQEKINQGSKEEVERMVAELQIDPRNIFALNPRAIHIENVGQIRKVIEGVPDNVPVLIEMNDDLAHLIIEQYDDNVWFTFSVDPNDLEYARRGEPGILLYINPEEPGMY